MAGQTASFHDDLKSLSWLFGRWVAAEGKGKYPTVADFTYGEKIEFAPIATKPIIRYSLQSYRTDNHEPIHCEVGHIRIAEGGSNKIAFIASHTNGFSEVQEGEVCGEELTVQSKQVYCPAFTKPPAVTSIKRHFKRNGNQLNQVLYMQTVNTPLTEHLRITYTKAQSRM